MKTQITVSKKEKKKRKTSHITGNRGTSCEFIACIYCLCFTMHVEMGLPGKTVEIQESQHQPRPGSLGVLHSI